ncbi:hypothetical protein DPMN_041157 [Dreissena polymorpha]|uniref:Uncharacterized protein n=1 Tax=Dreissena polymorpha TaxID=45954 RepID=A0A9D4CWE1_DREPO|nr:hypothetical protein DPMN_041157 [Dreissena polymorpha]
MRSQNRIYPFSYPLPSYEEIQADSTGGPGPPYPVLPPRYEDVILPDVPQPQISRSEPSRSNSYRGNI